MSPGLRPCSIRHYTLPPGQQSLALTAQLNHFGTFFKKGRLNLRDSYAAGKGGEGQARALMRTS